MKFIIDAQLPRRLMHRFRDAGYDAIHTSDLPQGNRTNDNTIIELAIHEKRIVVTKDSDFVDAFLVSGQPEKLLLISTGNIRNTELEHIIESNLTQIVNALRENTYVELTRQHVIIHC
jgi:predicted nuclease of predicted toxin-antitoxin system